MGASGQGGTSTTVAASGNQQIDGLLTGVKWNMSTITYTDPDSSADYQSGYFVDVNGNTVSAQNEGFSQISAAQLLAVHFALNQDIFTQPSGGYGFSVEAFTGLGISYGGSGLGTGTIRVADTSDNLYGYTYYPASNNYGGDAWLGSDIQSPHQGNYAWNNTLHELGHALGLKHGHEAGGPANTALPSNVDSLEYTVMTYRSYVGGPTSGYTNDTWDYPQTYMMLDIQALQYMYGADFTSAAANVGDTTYSWSESTGQSFVNGVVATNPGGNRILMTIWDGGGTDTYDLSNYTSALSIDLRPGKWSTFDTAQLADLDSLSPGTHMAAGNLANALQYNGDLRSLIENANGGSGNDTLTGNDIANVLNGNNGNDLIDGNGGDDTVNGNGGKDRFLMDASDGIDNFNGGSGVDTIDFRGLGANFIVANLARGVWKYTGTFAGDAIDIERILGTGGADKLIGNTAKNQLSGEDGNDTIFGGHGNDHLFGNVGDDVVKGGKGNDSLGGGIGKDLLSGGPGKDLFVFGSLGVSTVTPSGRDEITDFLHGQHDRVDVSDIDAKISLGGDQAFKFIGTIGFTSHEGELRYHHVGGNTFVSGDVNGDRVADFLIELDGKINLVAGDFLL
jgi:serralysin